MLILIWLRHINNHLKCFKPIKYMFKIRYNNIIINHLKLNSLSSRHFNKHLHCFKPIQHIFKIFESNMTIKPHQLKKKKIEINYLMHKTHLQYLEKMIVPRNRIKNSKTFTSMANPLITSSRYYFVELFYNIWTCETLDEYFEY